jgi:hypothetical protein
VLLDSGPLVLLMYGLVRPDRVGTGKTKQHTLKMYETLVREIEKCKGHVSLPNILTEASNHLGSGSQQHPVVGSANALSVYILELEEIYRPSKDVIGIREYLDVGLTDAAIISCAPRLKKDEVKVFTQDWELFNRLIGYGIDCINIMHWATPSKKGKI